MKAREGGSQYYSNRKVRQSLSSGYKDPNKIFKNLYSHFEKVENSYEKMGDGEEQIGKD